MGDRVKHDVREAKEDDLAAILRILAHEIEHGVAHFGTTPPSLNELCAEFAIAQGKYPWLVSIVHGEAIAFARCGPWKARGAYAWSAEIGLYVEAGRRSQGVGTALYTELFPRIAAAGLRTVLAGISLPNVPSVRLHERFGMVHVGTFPRVGFKHGAWRDVGYWHCCVGDESMPPFAN